MRLTRVTEPIGDFHARTIPGDLVEAEAWLFDPARPALVLGSSQDESIVDLGAARALGAEVVRRRSGGGAVWVPAAGCLWVDVVVPRADPRWSEDVRASVYWLGEAWTAALRAAGLRAELYEGGLEKTDWGRLVCFGALGPGEVLVDGRKAVGISQRRTREGARFQCIVYESWDADAVLDLLLMDDDERARASGDLAEIATGVGARLSQIETALVDLLDVRSMS
ncbi:lipoyl protein ligase domain-containing protein [Nocardioides montaniterrae]